MKIIIGAFDKVDIKLLSYENLFHHMDYRILQKALKLKSAKKLRKKFSKKVQNRMLSEGFSERCSVANTLCTTFDLDFEHLQ